MKHEVKKVFIAGGTGFLGYYTALLFLQKGVAVDTIALPNEIDLGTWYPKEIGSTFGDLFSMSEDEIVNLLKGKDYDTFIYALGPDDRTTPPAPAYEFFYERLVKQCIKICTAAKKAGVKRCVVMNSYFTYFDQQSGGLLSNYHPYISCRKQQAEAIINLGSDGKFEVMIMQLPYIFGNMPGRIPIWKAVFVERFRNLPTVFFPDGGTAAIHVTGVAEYMVAAAYNGTHGSQYPVSRINIKYRELIPYMMASAGFPKKFIKMPPILGYIAGLFLMAKEKKKDGKAAYIWQKQ